MSELVWLSLPEAARRVGRTSRQLRRWRNTGRIRQRVRAGYIEVELESLLAEWRRQTMANPITIKRLARAAREATGSRLTA